MQLDRTIAAISSSVGGAARIIVRLSGADAFSILNKLCPDRSREIAPVAVRAFSRIKGMRVPVWVYTFVGPRSYTGDDIVEVHLPGNPLLARLVLERMMTLGASQAQAGEFTARAFFNGRIDLSQAEGVAAVVSAGNQAELDAGRRLMNGELSRRLRPVMDELAQTLALIEAEIDFSDQDVRFVSAEEVNKRLDRAGGELEFLLKNSGRFSRLSHEPRLVLAGRPNAGKSTLLNALAGSARAVVSPVAGTTRDALGADVVLRRGMIRLVDVAGLEEDSPGDEIETQMRERALTELESADVVLLLIDAMDERPLLELARPADLVVRTKVDLRPDETVRVADDEKGGECPPYRETREIEISVKSGVGLDHLRAVLDRLAFGGAEGASELALSSRHVLAIEVAAWALRSGKQSAAAELIAADLRRALDSLGEVLGDISPDDILGRVFSMFCIGK